VEQRFAVASRRALVSSVRRRVESLNDLIAQTKAVGAPDGKRGARFAKAIVTHTRMFQNGLRKLIEEAKRLCTDSSFAWEADWRALNAKFDSLGSDLDKRTDNDPTITNAPETLYPAVVYWTTDASPCPSAELH
jgi:hypothetical protein